MIKVTDFIAGYLSKIGVRHVFMLTGGGAMHLNDSFGKQGEIEVVCNHHEQACAIAAEGYARVTGRLAVVNVTTGPGGLNTLTGVMGQWTDSVPVLYLSGQVRFDTTVYAHPELGLRQLGDQEVPIVDIVKPITKFATVLREPRLVRATLEKAIYLSTHGRPGPVWIDVPMNVQGALIDENDLPAYRESEEPLRVASGQLASDIDGFVELLQGSKRPAIIAGHGIRLAHALPAFARLLELLRLPVLSTFNGFDLIETENPLFVGRIGTIGNRAGNFALQNADLLLILGSRNNIRQASYNWDNFGRSARKVIVDVDRAELDKSTVRPDVKVEADLADFLAALNRQLAGLALPDWSSWLGWCQERKRRFPTVTSENTDGREPVDPYYFCRVLSELLPPNGVVITGNATPSIAYFQSAVVRGNQRVIWNSGCAAMGYDLPAAIGACFGTGKSDVVCLAGDGSLQLNIQELATVAYHRLPVKLFYFSNNGYISIRQTQDNFFEGRHVGTDPEAGVGLPDIAKIAAAYGLPFVRISGHRGMKESIAQVMAAKGPVVCELQLSTDYIFAPKLSSERKPDGRMISKPLEDMFPFLDREEFKANMIVEPLKE